MKIFKLIGSLLALAVIYTSCDKKIRGYAVESTYYYYLFLNVQDASGNDLVKDIDLHDDIHALLEVNRDLYTLDVVYPDVYMDPVWRSRHPETICENCIPDPMYYRLGYRIKDFYPGDAIKDDYAYLVFYPQVSMGNHWDKKIVPADKIIYQLKCPYLFGNDEVHEIVTYWEPSPQGNWEKQQFCYRIEFDGKEFDITYNETKTISYATIILEGK